MNYNHSNDKPIFSLDIDLSENLDKFNECEINIYEEKNEEPHFHITSKDLDISIKILSANYHHHNNDILDSYTIDQLNNYLEQIDVWNNIIDTWNKLNNQNINCSKPDYTKLYKEI